MAETKNLCALNPLDLYNRVTEAREALDQTTSEYITNLLTEYFEMKKNGEKETMATNSRTMAFQISEEFFQRIKDYLERETVHPHPASGERLERVFTAAGTGVISANVYR